MSLDNSKKHFHSKNKLIKAFTAELQRGIELIEKLDNSIYTRKENKVGSIGSHFRHNLDFANNFLKALETGKIDYTQRERNLRVEESREYAKEQFLFLIRSVQNLSTEDLEQEIVVRSEVDENLWHKSSISRELEFLHSHTIHHYALINEKLNSFGINVSFDFGVSPSTLKYWAEQNINAKVA